MDPTDGREEIDLESPIFVRPRPADKAILIEAYKASDRRSFSDWVIVALKHYAKCKHK